MTLQKVVMYLSILSPLLPLIAGIKKPSLIWYYVVVIFLSEILLLLLNMAGLAELKEVVANIFFFVSAVFVGGYFYKNIGKAYRLIVYVVAIVFTVLFFFILTRPFYSFNNLAAGSLSIGTILLCITGLYYILLNARITHLSRSSFFFVVIGFLIASCTSALLFLLANYLSEVDKTLLGKFWIINNLGGILQMLCFARALVIDKMKPDL